jgi:hypothetical protein
MLYEKVEKLNWIYAPSIIVPSYRAITDGGDVNISDNEVDLLDEIRNAVTSNFPNDFAHIPLSTESLKVVRQYLRGVQLKWPHTDDYVHQPCLGLCADDEAAWPDLLDVIDRYHRRMPARWLWMARQCDLGIVPATRYLPSDRNWTRLRDWLTMQQTFIKEARRAKKCDWLKEFLVPKDAYLSKWAEGWQFKRLSECLWDLKSRQMSQ